MEKLTNKNWKNKVVIPLLYRPLTTAVKLKVDEYYLRLDLTSKWFEEPVFTLRFFVNEKRAFEWQGEAKPEFHDIQKRFLHRKKLQIPRTASNIKKYGKRGISRINKIYAKEVYVLDWPSLTAFKNHLFKNNKEIFFITDFQTV